MMCPGCRSIFVFQEKDTTYEGKQWFLPYSLKCPICQALIHFDEKTTWTKLEGEPKGD